MNPMKQISDEEVSLAIRYLDPELNGEGELDTGHSWSKRAGRWLGIALLVLSISITLLLVLWNWLPSFIRPEIPVQ